MLNESEIIEDGVNGLLIDPTDEDQLIHALRRVCSDVELRERLGKQARQHVSRYYSPTAARSAYLQVFEALKIG